MRETTKACITDDEHVLVEGEEARVASDEAHAVQRRVGGGGGVGGAPRPSSSSRKFAVRVDDVEDDDAAPRSGAGRDSRRRGRSRRRPECGACRRRRLVGAAAQLAPLDQDVERELHEQEAGRDLQDQRRAAPRPRRATPASLEPSGAPTVAPRATMREQALARRPGGRGRWRTTRTGRRWSC